MLFRVKVLLLLIATFMMRPTAFGQSMSSLAIVISLGAVYFHIAEHSIKKNLRFARHIQFVLVVSVVMWVYFFSHAGIHSGLNFDFVVKATVTHIVILFSFALILSEEKANQMYFRGFIFIMMAFVISYYITLALSFVIPWEALFMFKIDVESYETTGKTYFPFTVLYSFIEMPGLNLPRLLGLFRESGIFQAFLIWALFCLKSYGLNRGWIKVVLFLGVGATLSTTGLAIYFVALALRYMLDRRSVKAVLIFSFMFYAAFYAPFIGLNEKSEKLGASVTDRSDATLEGLRLFLDHPFGTGMYNAGYSNVDQLGINLLSSMYMIGIIGVLLVLIVYFATAATVENKKEYFVAITPLFMTLLISQPVLDAPLFYIMLMAAYKNTPREGLPLFEQDAGGWSAIPQVRTARLPYCAVKTQERSGQ
ncbi:hypothetical protein SAMN04487970_101250 [Paenibacillus tianmuensis]|uniref:O-antigen ligase like membrane protein n=1 Tax=Paenibacillus tianmuensis TaxID=624147 RepID=A0A1G4R5M6_9BACL|nr:hypothetical protein [Paenibacillus tianmuensis]SCW52173.1 hypothetical protein SAMN04487970_101250 [Paenibacillus tianmuensis]